MRIRSVAASVAVALWATRGSEQSSPLRFPQGSGYNVRVREYPKLPPRLRWIFADNMGDVFNRFAKRGVISK